LREKNVFYWFWIGDHDEYERLIGGSVFRWALDVTLPPQNVSHS
jgi:hypothetical protein